MSVRLYFLPQEVLGRFQRVVVQGAYAKLCWTRSLVLMFDLQLLNSLKYMPHPSVLFQRMWQFQSPLEL